MLRFSASSPSISNPKKTQNQSMNFPVSADAKPRLKWTEELHLKFIRAINQLGGSDKATPKSLMTAMEIPGLTLYHLKSHLQKYRLGKNQQTETTTSKGEEDGKNLCSETIGNENTTMEITRALKMQMEVQRRLHEQIEVQRNLQMRIEAQGRYLQTILKRAQESLSGYCSSSQSVELARAELSQLVSMVNTGCRHSYSFSKLAETAVGLNLNDRSCFELSESSGIEDEGIGGKRSGSTISDGSCGGVKMKKLRLSEMIDLNR